jgi:hypothetical protein
MSLSKHFASNVDNKPMWLPPVPDSIHELAFFAFPRHEGVNLDVWIHIASFFNEFGAYMKMICTCRVNAKFWDLLLR